jgi:4-nitrophenyl phosphatase
MAYAIRLVYKMEHKMISELIPAIKGLILDMDGVLWRDDQPIGDLPHIFSRITDLGMKVILATNNAIMNMEQHQAKLASFGVIVEEWQVINSGMAVAYLLSQKYPKGGPVFIVGEGGLVKSLEEKGFYQSDQEVLAVIGGFDRNISFGKFSQATQLIRKGAPFYGTNPDRTFPTPKGLIPGAGSFLAFIEAASSVSPIIAGKPNPTLFKLAFERLALPSDQILAIGDRLDTDILGGQRAGCKTALVLSGVTSLHELEFWSPAPDIVAPDLTSVLEKR